MINLKVAYAKIWKIKSYIFRVSLPHVWIIPKLNGPRNYVKSFKIQLKTRDTVGTLTIADSFISSTAITSYSSYSLGAAEQMNRSILLLTVINEKERSLTWSLQRHGKRESYSALETLSATVDKTSWNDCDNSWRNVPWLLSLSLSLSLSLFVRSLKTDRVV